MEEESTNCCAICFESDDRVIRPCQCSALAHTECLQQWWQTTDPSSPKTCFSCKRVFAQTIKESDTVVVIGRVFVFIIYSTCLFMSCFLMTLCLMGPSKFTTRDLAREVGIACGVYLVLAGAIIGILARSRRLRASGFFTCCFVQYRPSSVRVQLADAQVDVRFPPSSRTCIVCDSP